MIWRMGVPCACADGESRDLGDGAVGFEFAGVAASGREIDGVGHGRLLVNVDSELTIDRADQHFALLRDVGEQDAQAERDGEQAFDGAA
jgi:hypothetical protein